MEFVATVDSAGRVLIPKVLRESLYLHRGTRLRIVRKDRSLVIEPIEDVPLLLVRDGMTLIGGELQRRVHGRHVDARDARLATLVKRVTSRGQPG